MGLKRSPSKQPYCTKCKKLTIVLHTTAHKIFLVYSQPESGHLCSRNMEINSENHCKITRYDCRCVVFGRGLLYNEIQTL